MLLCQRMGALDKAGLMDPYPAIKAKWEAGYLGMIKHMCSSPEVPKVGGYGVWGVGCGAPVHMCSSPEVPKVGGCERRGRTEAPKVCVWT